MNLDNRTLSRTGYAILQRTRSTSPDLCASIRAARQADHAKDPTMHHARRRLIIAAALLALLLTVSPADARWRTAEIGFINMERACRDGALVSIITQSDGSADATRAVGARRHDNLAAAPEPDKSTGNVPPRPLDDYGPNIVAAPQMRDVTLTSQSLAREADVDRGNGMPDIVQKYGISVLPWSAPQPVGTPVILVYQRVDNMEVGIAEEIVADCTIGVGNTTTITASALPGGDSAIPPAQLTYQVVGWPSYGQLVRDLLPLAPGTRFSAADLTGHPLTYATNRTPPGELLPIGVAGADLVSQIADRQANIFSANSPAISADGRYVAFETSASTLVQSDTNDITDIFVYDRQAGQTSRVSINSSGIEGDSGSTTAAISGDGRYVAFQSQAKNLVALDANDACDIFVHDRQTGQTTRVSVSSSGAEAQGASNDPAISADGRYVAFVSDAANLVAGDTGGYRNVFLHDQKTGQTNRISAGFGGATVDGDSDSPAISGDGSTIVFRSDATNLLATGSDTNSFGDIFAYDRPTGTISRVSVTSGGAQAQGESTSPAISADGRAIVFASNADNLSATDTGGFSNIYLRDRQTGQTVWVSHALDGSAPNGFSDTPTISGDGNLIAFVSSANNLVGYDAKSLPDVFLFDRQQSTISCLSVNGQGGAADSSSGNPAISADGRFTAFESYASNLLPNPIDTHGDIYVRYHTQTTIVVGLPYQVYAPLTRR
jgi:Tol biopolymer transport system component